MMVDCDAVYGFLHCKRSSIVCQKVIFYNVSDDKMFLRKCLHTVFVHANLLEMSVL